MNNIMSKNLFKLNGQIPKKRIQITKTDLRRMISEESYYY